jgi:hypothetical protein
MSTELTGEKEEQTLVCIKQNKRAYEKARNNGVADFSLHKSE